MQGEVALLFSVSGGWHLQGEEETPTAQSARDGGLRHGQHLEVVSRTRTEDKVWELEERKGNWTLVSGDTMNKEGRCGGLPVLQTRRTFGVPVGRVMV